MLWKELKYFQMKTIHNVSRSKYKNTFYLMVTQLSVYYEIE